jgi:hypothetical protein
VFAVGLIFMVEFFVLFSNVLRDTKKLRTNPEDEIIETALWCLPSVPASEEVAWSLTDRQELSYRLLYIARVVERAGNTFRSSLKSATTEAMVQRQYQGIAASIRKLALNVIFAKTGTREEVRESLSRLIRAVSTGRWGELEGEVPASPNTVSTIRRVLSSLKSIVVAIGPIIIVLAAPRILEAQNPPIEVDGRLTSTLATVSIAWLVVYLISWLDPRASEHVTTTGSVIGMISRRDSQ